MIHGDETTTHESKCVTDLDGKRIYMYTISIRDHTFVAFAKTKAEASELAHAAFREYLESEGGILESD